MAGKGPYSGAVSSHVVMRLVSGYAKARPNDSAEQLVKRANDLIASVRSVGLDIVFQEWIDDPAYARAGADKQWDPFIEALRTVYRENADRAPWKP